MGLTCAMGNPRYANGNTRRKIRARWIASGEPCHICGKPIDYSLGMIIDPWTGKRRPHPMSLAIDEIVPVSKGGDPLDFSNTRPTHWICNAKRGDGTGKKRHATARGALPQPWDL